MAGLALLVGIAVAVGASAPSRAAPIDEIGWHGPRTLLDIVTPAPGATPERRIVVFDDGVPASALAVGPDSAGDLLFTADGLAHVIRPAGAAAAGDVPVRDSRTGAILGSLPRPTLAAGRSARLVALVSAGQSTWVHWRLDPAAGTTAPVEQVFIDLADGREIRWPLSGVEPVVGAAPRRLVVVQPAREPRFGVVELGNEIGLLDTGLGRVDILPRPAGRTGSNGLRVAAFAPEGEMLAWLDGGRLTIFDLAKMRIRSTRDQVIQTAWPRELRFDELLGWGGSSHSLIVRWKDEPFFYNPLFDSFGQLASRRESTALSGDGSRLVQRYSSQHNDLLLATGYGLRGDDRARLQIVGDCRISADKPGPTVPHAVSADGRYVAFRPRSRATCVTDLDSGLTRRLDDRNDRNARDARPVAAGQDAGSTLAAAIDPTALGIPSTRLPTPEAGWTSLVRTADSDLAPGLRRTGSSPLRIGQLNLAWPLLIIITVLGYWLGDLRRRLARPDARPPGPLALAGSAGALMLAVVIGATGAAVGLMSATEAWLAVATPTGAARSLLREVGLALGHGAYPYPPEVRAASWAVGLLGAIGYSLVAWRLVRFGLEAGGSSRGGGGRGAAGGRNASRDRRDRPASASLSDSGLRSGGDGRAATRHSQPGQPGQPGQRGQPGHPGQPRWIVLALLTAGIVAGLAGCSRDIPAAVTPSRGPWFEPTGGALLRIDADRSLTPVRFGDLRAPQQRVVGDQRPFRLYSDDGRQSIDSEQGLLLDTTSNRAVGAVRPEVRGILGRAPDLHLYLYRPPITRAPGFPAVPADMAGATARHLLVELATGRTTEIDLGRAAAETPAERFEPRRLAVLQTDPTGRRAVIDSGEQAFLVELATHRVWPLGGARPASARAATARPEKPDRVAAFSRDGTRLAMLDPDRTLRILALDGRAGPIAIDATRAATAPAPTASSRLLGWTAGTDVLILDDGAGLVGWSADGQRAERLVQPRPAWSTLSRDGRVLVFGPMRGDVQQMALDARHWGRARPVAVNCPGEPGYGVLVPGQPIVSDDGTLLAMPTALVRLQDATRATRQTIEHWPCLVALGDDGGVGAGAGSAASAGDGARASAGAGGAASPGPDAPDAAAAAVPHWRQWLDVVTRGPLFWLWPIAIGIVAASFRLQLALVHRKPTTRLETLLILGVAGLPWIIELARAPSVALQVPVMAATKGIVAMILVTGRFTADLAGDDLAALSTWTGRIHLALRLLAATATCAIGVLIGLGVATWLFRPKGNAASPPGGAASRP